jgi:two-component system, cell cycle sensor histidine kinase and response regulator CckA
VHDRNCGSFTNYSSLAPDLGAVEADPGQLEQVLMNLAVNARDAMPQGGQLTIETRNGEREVLLAVRDTGAGMTETVKARIFEPFFTTKGPGKGTGLGLSVVHGVVEQAGGHIEVESEPGVGTTFLVYLPRLNRPASPPPSLHDLGPAPRGTETVLLVEDDPAVRGLTAHCLRHCGSSVLVADGAKEALRMAWRHGGPIQLLVTDVVMPNMGGRQLAEQLLLLHPEIQVLYLSGYTDDAVVRHGVRQGQVPFLQKPFSPLILAHTVREVLDGSLNR